MIHTNVPYFTIKVAKLDSTCQKTYFIKEYPCLQEHAYTFYWSSTSYQLPSFLSEATGPLNSEKVPSSPLKCKNRKGSRKKTLQEKSQLEKFNCLCPPLTNVTITLTRKFWNVSGWHLDCLAVHLSAVIHLPGKFTTRGTFLTVQGS